MKLIKKDNKVCLVLDITLEEEDYNYINLNLTDEEFLEGNFLNEKKLIVAECIDLKDIISNPKEAGEYYQIVVMREKNNIEPVERFII